MIIKLVYIETILMIFLALAGCEKHETAKTGLFDIDGNVYDTVVIGTQVWMSENLRTSRLNDGKEIQLVPSDTAWANLKTPGYCWYGNYELFFSLNHYGALYNYYAVATGKLCPAGWHVPTTDEWETLINYLGIDSAGAKMKETGTVDWLTPNYGATNESGFSALPGGFRDAYYNDFRNFRSSGYFWHGQYSDAMVVSYLSINSTHGSESRQNGCSVRCIRDK